MIGIIDYGMGNLHSVSKALERLGYEYKITSDINELVEMDGLILPGVGAFPDAMEMMQESGLAAFVQDWAYAGKPILGICLGMQLFFKDSLEHTLTEGIGLLPGHVVPLTSVVAEDAVVKIPHMGWNKLLFMKEDHPLLEGIEEGYVYFVHSYAVTTDELGICISTTSYGMKYRQL